MQYPPEIAQTDKDIALTSSQQWALAHGLCLLVEGDKPNRAQHAPYTLFPTPFPKQAFNSALEVQTLFNQLYVSVASRPEWLESVVSELGAFDPDFTGKLLELHLKAKKAPGPRQKLTGGVFRSDYILNSKDQIKQVEFNAVSVSFGALSSKVSALHRYLVRSGAYGIDYPLDSIPESPSLQKITESLAKMHKAYQKSSEDEETAILVVVQPGERNIFDQRLIEFELFEKHGIVTHRVTLGEVKQKTQLVEGNILYHNDSGAEISVVYYRSGYAPGDYVSKEEWDARLMLECSYAIQCPSILTQLSGAKKIQQLLTEPSVVRKVAPRLTKAEVEKLSESFVAIHPFDDESPEGRHARTLAFDHPQNYVLKPQREGGGNNIYRDNIPGFLTQTPKSNWPAYILMELINPPKMNNEIVRDGEIISGEIVSELGVFGGALWDRDSGDLKFEDTCGWLLRSKMQSSDEGGVAAGFGCVDGVYLV